MKVTTLLLLLAINAVMLSLPGFTDKICTDYFDKEEEDRQAFSKDFCRSLGITGDGDKCCYLKYKKGENYFFNCIQVTMEEFYNIKEHKKNLAASKEWDIKSIECDSSSYLYASLLLLLVFLF